MISCAEQQDCGGPAFENETEKRPARVCQTPAKPVVGVPVGLLKEWPEEAITDCKWPRQSQ